MSSQQVTPRRRNLPRQSAADRPSMYADLLIDQLLAQAQTDSGSSNSNSPPDVLAAPNDYEGAAAAALPHQLYSPELNAAGGEQMNPLHAQIVHEHINFNRGSDHLHYNDYVNSRFSPVVDASETIEFESKLFELSEDSEMHPGKHALPMVAPQQPVSYNHNSNFFQESSNSSSSNSSVPDLDKELVSRVQYYSDFTIDRQKKIDNAVEINPESTESSSPTSTASSNSSEHISPRCVEGSENNDLFKKPLLINKPSVSAQTGRKDVKMQHKSNRCSSERAESDSSSGTGSMPRSQYSSRPSSRYSSNRSSRHSSRNRQSASSSDDHRSSSRGSRCSSHPLASSTLISDPSNTSGSAESGSVYTWSMDNNSDENLHKSFLRSEKRHHRRSRPSHRKSSARKSSQCHHTTGRKGGQHRIRPDTLIGEDSPPQEQPSSSFITPSKLSLTNSAVATPSRRFGSTIYENCAKVTSDLRSASLPRTSTQRHCLVLNRESCKSNRAASNPELSSPTYPHTDCTVSMIGPSVQSCDLHRSQVTGRCSPPLVFRPELLGKSSTSGSSNSYYSQCLTCNPALTESCSSYPMSPSEHGDHCDDILTNSPTSVDSGAQPPYNSYTSPVGSTNEYTTISDSSAEHSVIVTSAPRQPRAFAVKDGSGVFKVPFSPATRTVKRKVAAGGRSTHSVGVRTAGTPCLPVGLAKHTELNPRKKHFMGTPAQSAGSSCHPPKIFDKKSLARKIKKFSNHFKKDKGSTGTQIHTLANL